jgi:phosphoserine aminotransferase
MDLPWEKLDVITWSWQKVMGGEAAHGMLALSPRAVERLETYTPSWPIPKLFRLTKSGKLISDIFEGATINTPSMLAVEDHLDALDWAESLGGLSSLIERSSNNLNLIRHWTSNSQWATLLTQVAEQQSSTSICLSVSDSDFQALEESEQRAFIKHMTQLLEREQVAFDIAAYRDAPPGLRLWGGATVESSDLSALLLWLDWAFAATRAEFTQ